jgi:hypothetical protein
MDGSRDVAMDRAANAAGPNIEIRNPSEIQEEKHRRGCHCMISSFSFGF